ncbi:MAG: hypothetical protein K2Y71_29240 [Xanthobacteraceae bacterium]|nr:hypothetical protein [Xanthobacteraceae bacterium]
MDAFIFRFDVKAFQAIPESYQGFLVTSGMCCNELTLLLPYIMFEHNPKGANEFEASFIVARKLTVDRILVSKIFEYGKLCSVFFRQNKASTDPLLAELSKSYEPIAQEITSAKWAAILRNKISFHYDRQHALASVKRLAENHPLRFMAGRFKGLTLYDFAEEISSRPIYEHAGNGDVDRGLDVAHKFILHLYNLITSFHVKATMGIFRTYGMVTERVPSKLRNKYCALPGAHYVPISVSPSYLSSTAKKVAARKRRAKAASKRV